MSYIKILILSFTLSSSASTFAHCSEDLLVGYPSDRIISDILSSLSESGVLAREVDRVAFEILTGLTSEQLEDPRDEGLVRRLLPIQGWRHFIPVVAWRGHAYSEVPNWRETRIYNSFWGRAINLRSQDWLHVALHHQAFSDESWVNLSVGPIDPASVEQKHVIENLTRAGLAAGARIDTIQRGDRSLYLLVVHGLRNNPNTFSFLKKLTAQMQNRND